MRPRDVFFGSLFECLLLDISPLIGVVARTYAVEAVYNAKNDFSMYI